MEEEKIREKVARQLADWDGNFWDELLEDDEGQVTVSRSCYYSEADQILAIDGIRIECERQELPNKIKYGGNQMSAHYNTGYTDAQQDMLTPKDGKVWVRCLVKEEK